MTTKALNDLPLEKLIGEPLFAAAKAQLELSASNLKSLKEYAAQENEVFEFKRKNEAGKMETIELSVPVLALAELSNLSIERLVNEFTFEVSSIQDDVTEKTGSLSGSASAGGFISKFVDFNLEAGYNKTQRSQSTQNERGKLNISVVATRTGQTKAMQVIMDAATKAITAKGPDQPPAKK